MRSDFQETRKCTEDTLERLGVRHHMFYGPTTDSYWDQHIKILTINLEPYGYEDFFRYSVGRDDLLDWMYDAGSTRTRTTRNTIAACKVLMDGFYKRKQPSPERLHEAYHNQEGLEKTLDQICYFNIRPVSNHEKPENWSRGDSDGKGAVAECVKQELLSLDPDVILVSGVQPARAVNSLLCSVAPLAYLGACECGGFKIISVRHFSRPSYGPLAVSLCKAVDYLLVRKPLNT